MLLQCRNIDFRYPGTEIFLFQDLSMAIDAPGFHALFGPSGVGKSSLAKIISGQLIPESGTVHYHHDGRPLYGYNLERLPGWSSIGRHLERVTPAHHRALKETLIDAFGLAEVMGQHFSRLSLGQQNRVNLLRYLVQDFNALIMDESLANVDEKTREQILLTIKEMFPDALFLYISHNVVEVATFCRQILVLRALHKTPRVVTVQGQDHKEGIDLDRQGLQQTMLEIMNAA